MICAKLLKVECLQYSNHSIGISEAGDLLLFHSPTMALQITSSITLEKKNRRRQFVLRSEANKGRIDTNLIEKFRKRGTN